MVCPAPLSRVALATVAVLGTVGLVVRPVDLEGDVRHPQEPERLGEAAAGVGRSPDSLEPADAGVDAVAVQDWSLRVQLLDRHGEPLRDQELQCLMELEGLGPKRRSVRSDAEGWAEFGRRDLGRMEAEFPPLVRWEWHREYGCGPFWRLEFDPPLAEGRREFPALSPWPLLSGRIVDVHGEPVGGARVGRAVWTLDCMPSFVSRSSEADGRFAIYGELGGLPPVLVARGEGALSEPLHSDSLSGEPVEFVLLPVGEARVRTASGASRPPILWTTPGGSLESDQAFVFLPAASGDGAQTYRLPAGRYDAHLWGRRGGEQRSLRVIPDVQFTEGEPSVDPRLNPLQGY